MRLGAFSVSLSVADLAASRAFYERLGFTELAGGSPEKSFLILRNPDGHVVGLFHGMFEGNLLTFNPGWDQRGQPVDGDWTDARELQRRLGEAGIAPVKPIGEEAGASGPAHFVVVDPDGNTILVDQHR